MSTRDKLFEIDHWRHNVANALLTPTHHEDRDPPRSYPRLASPPRYTTISSNPPKHDTAYVTVTRSPSRPRHRSPPHHRSPPRSRNRSPPRARARSVSRAPPPRARARSMSRAPLTRSISRDPPVLFDRAYPSPALTRHASPDRGRGRGRGHKRASTIIVTSPTRGRVVERRERFHSRSPLRSYAYSTRTIEPDEGDERYAPAPPPPKVYYAQPPHAPAHHLPPSPPVIVIPSHRSHRSQTPPPRRSMSRSRSRFEGSRRDVSPARSRRGLGRKSDASVVLVSTFGAGGGEKEYRRGGGSLRRGSREWESRRVDSGFGPGLYEGYKGAYAGRERESGWVR
ncbi:hypothetical protein EJ06DRAFT_37754 [Trichodelitschia bisporula]|uniref:Uncharacterized protein n=1 Tax=Trichodelitschia bisporula TaxID=703511 RepID=A0A6G1HUY4_9PEZI|nr:hypothetical protein EJ06DRAFT_37754 [Trichodelitschia bisporula]